ncbi:copper chaperone PCu(A)C [Sphingomonas sp. AOB5]|uniref:copper chaperone PCu(A)C n=1 Tax=Sphingomonas sp. AOB5 TaxID=3034017 RepID=UPI0023F7C734|nr:copper chaperone PCu(A)C [Sphingomonas sp. AOB5]MDF7777225.1 copper chaperone PCu(A)C [Sphingomonas sp. AOB5]
MRNLIGIAALALVTACQQAPAELKADGAWVRLPAVAGNPAAAYFTLHGGNTDATLMSVRAKFAIGTELHESMKHDMPGHEGMNMDGGAMSMQPIKDVPVPARGTVTFEPGGKHVMLFDVSPSLKAGQKAPLTFHFADGKTIEVQAVIVGAGDSAPK